MRECKKCLLLEAGESVTYEQVMAYVNTLDLDALADEATAERRLSHCKACEQLIAGMCRKCGCYVEVRARLKKAVCPDYGSRKW